MTLYALGALRTSAAAELLLETRKGCRGRTATEAALKPTCVPGINARTKAVVLSAMPADIGHIGVAYTTVDALQLALLAADMHYRPRRPQRLATMLLQSLASTRHAFLLANLSRVAMQHLYYDSSAQYTSTAQAIVS